KPSAMFHPAGSVARLSTVEGSVPSGIASRRPVTVDASSTSNAELGHGVMQCTVPSGLAGRSAGRLVSLLHAASAPAPRPQHATATSERARAARPGAVEEASRMAVTLTHVTPLDK